MKLFVDGKEIAFQNSVAVVWENETLPLEGMFFEGVNLNLTANTEGIVLDIINPETEAVELTAAQDLIDLAELCQ